MAEPVGRGRCDGKSRHSDELLGDGVGRQANADEAGVGSDDGGDRGSGGRDDGERA